MVYNVLRITLWFLCVLYEVCECTQLGPSFEIRVTPSKNSLTVCTSCSVYGASLFAFVCALTISVMIRPPHRLRVVVTSVLNMKEKWSCITRDLVIHSSHHHYVVK